jgi:GAF domain-containing protein
MKLPIFHAPARPKSSPDRPDENEKAPGDSGPGNDQTPIQAITYRESTGRERSAGSEITQVLDTPIENLRQQILNRLIQATILLGVLVYLLELPGMFQEPFASSLKWIVLGLYSLTWIALWVAVIRKRMAYARRVAVLLLALYASGLIALLTGGAYGNGQVILVVAPFIAAILLGPRGRTTSLLLSIGAVTLGIVLIISRPFLAQPIAPGPGNLLSWIISLLIFSLVAISGVISLGRYLDDLHAHLDRQRSLASQLETERDQQVAIATQKANDLHRRLVQIRTVAEINRAISRVMDIDQLLPQVCELVRQRFNLYYVGIFLLEQTVQDQSQTPAKEQQQYAVLKAGSGEAGRIMLAEGHKLAVGGDSMIGWATANRQPRIAQKVRQEGVTGPIARFDNPHLPLTRSELALPIQVSDTVVGGQDLAQPGPDVRVLGAMTIQSTQEGAFDQDDILILQGIADGLASAIENARLFETIQSNLEEIRTLHRQYLEQAWQLESALRGKIEYSYEDPTQTMVESFGISPDKAENRLEIPIRLRDQVIGSLTLEPKPQGRESPEEHRAWTAEDLALVEAVTNQTALALENARLLEETRRKVNLERAAANITSKLWASADVETILRTALQELGASLGAREGLIELWPPESQPGIESTLGKPVTDRLETQGEVLDGIN